MACVPGAWTCSAAAAAAPAPASDPADASRVGVGGDIVSLF